MTAIDRRSSNAATLPGIETSHGGAAPPPRKATAVQGIVLSSMQTLSVMGIILITPILPAMQAHFAATPHAEVLVRIALTVPALCVSLLSPLFGALADHFSGRRLLLASIPFYALFGTAPLYVHSLNAIILTRLGVGVAEAVLVTASTVLISDYFQGHARERWFAAQTAIAAMSAVVLFLVGGVLGNFGWRVPFAAYGSSLVMFALVVAFTWETPHRTKLAVGAASFPWRRTAGLYALSLLVAVLFYVVPIQLPFVLTMHGITLPSRIGIATAIGSAGVPLGSAFFAWKARWPLMSLLLFGFTLLGAGMLGVASLRTYDMIVSCVVVSQFGSGVLLPALLTRVVDTMPPTLRGRGSGAWMSCLFLGQFVSPLVVLAVAGMLAGPLRAIACLALLSLATAAIVPLMGLAWGRLRAA